LDGQVAPVPVSWTRDGLVAYVDFGETTSTDIWVLDTRSNKAQPVVQTAAQEMLATLSSDGKWLAYNSNEAGRDDVYVQPYPGPGPRVLVSRSAPGGFAPTWRGDGAELYYYTGTEAGLQMHAVSLQITEAGVSVGAPRALFQGRYVGSSPGRAYDVTSDGQRFVMVRRIDRPTTAAVPMMVLVENWFEELKRLAR
jgi:hypothetical protein